MRFADLHLHTVFSDGTYTPLELVRKAKKAGLDTVAVVDHDTVEGVTPSMEAAEGEGLEVLPGIELSAEYKGAEIHILGYLIEHKNASLIERLSVLRKNRVERIYNILEKLKEAGIDLEAKDVFDIAKNGTVGRLHVARALLKKGKVSSIFEAFQKHIGDNCPAHVLGFKFQPQEAIDLIKEAGGIPVLAHPYVLNNDELIPEFAGMGLLGLEVYYPEHSQSMVNYYLRVAKEYGLLVTGGSDCHGMAKPEAKIGSIKIPYGLVELLKAAQAKLYEKN